MSVTQLRKQYLELSGRYAVLKDQYRAAEWRLNMMNHGTTGHLADMAIELVKAWGAMHNARIQLKTEEERHEREQQQRLEGC
jgi:hypothetical protein